MLLNLLKKLFLPILILATTTSGLPILNNMHLRRLPLIFKNPSVVPTSLQADAYYNRGNALLAQTTELTEPEDIDTAIQLAFEALEQFEFSLSAKAR